MNLSARRTTDFTKAYDWKALVAASSDASKAFGALDPRYGKEYPLSTGFQGRIGVKFMF